MTIRPKLKKRLGDLLVEERIISADDLAQALQIQKQSGRKLGATLIALGAITEHQLLVFLAQQLDVPYLDISQKRLSPDIVQLLPEVQARRHRALCIEVDNNVVTIGMSDPADLNALDALYALLAPKEIKIVAVRESQLLEAFDNLYRRTADIESFASQLDQEYSQTADFDIGELLTGDESDEEATVVKLLNTIFEDAVQTRASDIHIEPDENKLRIRMRIDGVLQENILNESRIATALVLRLKLMSGLDISEKRLPQDGRFNIKIQQRSIDMRISTMPIQYGESVVMRLLDQANNVLTLNQTGMPDAILQRLRNILSRPHGMVLVTGPTGSGKTTTLYGALSELNQASKKIITVEDPVEYRLPRINQVQVNPKIDLHFATVLRTALRQDPDIIMVGEMRDHETIEIGLRSALTGHLVLSTLHTNDAVSSVIRLLDMQAPGYLVASSLRAILAQRLIRKLCDNCKHEHDPEPAERLWLNGLAGRNLDGIMFSKGNGCQSCNYVGYKGRIGVFELLEIDERLMSALKNDDTDGFAAAARANKHYRPLATVALDYALQGITSTDEVLKLVDNVADLEQVAVTYTKPDKPDSESGLSLEKL